MRNPSFEKSHKKKHKQKNLLDLNIHSHITRSYRTKFIVNIQ